MQHRSICAAFGPDLSESESEGRTSLTPVVASTLFSLAEQPIDTSPRDPIFPFFLPDPILSILQPRLMRRCVSESFHPTRSNSLPGPYFSSLLDINFKLPCKVQERGAYISGDTLADVLSGCHNKEYDRVLLVDSRFYYEFEGGHIRNAVNISTPSQLYQILSFEKGANQPKLRIMDVRTLIVFYCEYSHKRSPTQRTHIISLDRQRQDERGDFGRVHYPEMYLLEGGYKSFYAKYPHYCEPRGYVPESLQNLNDLGDEKCDDPYAEQSKRLMDEFDRVWPWKKSSKQRSRTPAFDSKMAFRASAPTPPIRLEDPSTHSAAFVKKLEDDS